MGTRSRLAVGAAVVVGVTAYMAYVGGSSTWQYYVTVDECVANASELVNHRVRVSGKIASNSLHVSRDRDEATFLLEGAGASIRVNCRGPFPDNLAEQRDVVVEGRMDDANGLVGHKVLTRCASKYSSRNGSVAGDQLPRN